MSSIVGFHCVNEIKKTDSSVRLKMKNGTGTPCLRPVDMMRASSRPWGQFIPCRFRWFHKRRQIPLTSLQTFNLKKKKKKGSKGREAPGDDVSQGECWQTQNTRKINHKASLCLDLFKKLAPHSGELFFSLPVYKQPASETRMPASCLIWGGEVLDV